MYVSVLQVQCGVPPVSPRTMYPQTPATAPAKFPRPDSTSATTDVNNTATPVPNSDKFELPYDKLVIAVGPTSGEDSLASGMMMLGSFVTDTGSVPGWCLHITSPIQRLPDGLLLLIPMEQVVGRHHFESQV